MRQRHLFAIAFSLLILQFPSKVHATTLVDINHETGDFTQYTMNDTNGGDLTVSPIAALAGTSKGLSVKVNDSSRLYGVKVLSSASTTGVTRARFYIDPNGLIMPDLSQVSLIFLINSGGTENFALVKLIKIGGAYNLRGVMIDDNGIHQETKAWAISDAPHMVEIKVTKSTSASANDAKFETWIDGVAKETMTGVDSYNRYRDFKYVSLGLNGISGTINGTYYLDELIVNDDGAVIGPTGSSNPPSGTKIPGDTDNSGHVDIYDFNNVMIDFGTSNARSNFDGLGLVDIYDYNILMTNFGK